jgi:hypothetical protein
MKLQISPVLNTFWSRLYGFVMVMVCYRAPLVLFTFVVHFALKQNESNYTLSNYHFNCSKGNINQLFVIIVMVAQLVVRIV